MIHAPAPPTEDDAALARLREGLALAAHRGGDLDIAYREIDSPVGPLLLAATPTGLLRVAFDREDHAAVLADLAGTVSPRVMRLPAALESAARSFGRYFEGRDRSLDVTVDLQLARGFRREVLEHLREIPAGRTASYSELAGRVGRPRAVRATASACATNPLPLALPCHRVVRSDGSPGEYLGGADAKRWLLALESVAT